MSKKSPKLEDSFSQLEQIVTQIESGEIGLEESLVKLKEGMSLAGNIRKRLTKIQEELSQLMD